MGLAIWHVRHLLFDFASYYMENSSRFSRFRAIVEHYPVQGVLAGTLCTLLIEEDKAGHVIFAPPPELFHLADFPESPASSDELLWDYVETMEPLPSAENQLVPRPSTPLPIQSGTPLGSGRGSPHNENSNI